MTTKFNKIFNINGVIDPNQSVMSNLNTLCTASGCWLTFDFHTGQWAVIINKPAAVQHYFGDSNIIGAINVLGTGLNEFYNRVSVAFNHRDLDDKVDYIDMVIPADEKFPNETENTLHMEFDCINDPVQAMYLGAVELKQSRLDKVIEFRTDYSAIGIKAGDIIAVTAEMYGFNEKQFRIVKIAEEDADNGAILLSITGIEYSADIYSTSGLIREERDLYNGIIPKAANEELLNADKEAATGAITSDLAGSLAGADDAALLLLLSRLMNGLGAVGVSVCVSAGSRRFTNLPLTMTTTTADAPRNTPFVEYIGTFKPVVSGYYQATIVADQNGSGCIGRDADIAGVSVSIIENAPDASPVYAEGSGGHGTWYWNDWVLGGVCRLEKGKQYNIAFFYAYGTEDGPSTIDPIDITVTWSINSLPGTIVLDPTP